MVLILQNLKIAHSQKLENGKFGPEFGFFDPLNKCDFFLLYNTIWCGC